ncbi:MAG: exo-beta-N-acetylmuramidase NamZ domain-containing protein [Planctomycetota bacterium]|nr:exo-beta-N-acetylmuramidase NamZ domain-containing protein [Planctomycetota bacterium]
MRALAGILITTTTLLAQGIEQRSFASIIAKGCEGASLSGAVCVIDRGGVSTQRAAISHAADAVFDCASLTKVVATTTCVMKLVEEGRLALDDKAADHLPGFGANGKESITIEQLLRHRSGLLPDNALADYLQGPREARRKIYALGLRAPPDTRTIYTDVGFITLGWIVERITNKPLDVYAKEVVFDPCGMKDTRFVRADAPVDPSWASRCIPTEAAAKGGSPLQGVVHDPRARALGGIAGHAGMFSTAEDLRRFGRMIAAGGVTEEGRRVLATETVARMTRRSSEPGYRGLGWRLGSAGVTWHTGFTGTAIWISPGDAVTVLLTSRLYPDGKGTVGGLRNLVTTLVGCAPDGVLPGVDVIAMRGWPRDLRGLKVGLITNHTGRTRDGRSTIDVLNGSERVTLAALFSPEHGIRGALDSKVDDAVDKETGLKVHSLYGSTRRPSAASLAGVDALVFDIQDIGTRFYTYVSTMVNAMEEAARHDLLFIVLDRPNPISGRGAAGPIADEDALDFVGRLRIPIRHGLTVGELAHLARADLGLSLRLRVIRCEGWVRDRHLDECPLPWVNPSPNMRSLDEALLYPGIGILETTNLSVGRGTATPFEHVGAPWMNGEAVARALRAAGIPGVDITATAFTPTASKFKGQPCSGVRFTITDRIALPPVRLGLTLASILVHHHGDAWDTGRLNRLLKNQRTRDGLLARRSYATVESAWQADLAAFRARRIWLYPTEGTR